METFTVLTGPSEKGYRFQNAEHTVKDKFCSPLFTHRYAVDQQSPTLGFSGIVGGSSIGPSIKPFQDGRHGSKMAAMPPRWPPSLQDGRHDL